MNERSSLYRREHHKEAMVWQDRGRQDRQTEDEDEDRQTDAELKHMVRTHRTCALTQSIRVGKGGGSEFEYATPPF